MRAKTVPHVEYEIFMHLLKHIDVSEVKEKHGSSGDEVAEKDSPKGLESCCC